MFDGVKTVLTVIRTTTGCMVIIELLNRLVDYNEIWQEGDDLDSDHETTFLNLVASAIPQWRTFKLLRWVWRNSLIPFEPIGQFGLHFVRK
jgi:hypothetical protein